MIRLLLFIALVLALGLGFTWLADRPGTLVATIDNTEVKVSLLVAAVSIVALVAAILLTWWVLKSIWNSPHSLRRYFRARKRDRGYQSLSTGMIAAGAGDAVLARRMNKQAGQNLSSDQEPLLHLLDAQTLLLEGDRDGAREKFEAMVEDPETRLLGLRGLYLEAQRVGDPDAARHFAEQAAIDAPQLDWAANAALESKVAAADWNAALQLLDKQAATGKQAKDAVKRKRAVVMTAKAMELVDSDPTAARNSALEASRLEPDFVPATLVAARALVRLNDLRKAAKILEAQWKKDPHPQIAQAYIHLRPGDSTHDRLDRAQRLFKLKGHNPEASFIIARAAYEAGEYTDARKALEAMLKSDPREGAYLLLADIEEDETGNQGRVRHWLGKALRAQRDPAWTADGVVSDTWAPISPVTGRFDAFEWRVPVEKVAPLLEDQAEEAFESTVAVIEAPKPKEPVAEDSTLIEAEPAASEPSATETATEAGTVDTPKPEEERPSATVIPIAEHVEPAEPAQAESAAEKPDTPESETAASVEEAAETVEPEAVEAAKQSSNEPKPDEQPVAAPDGKKASAKPDTTPPTATDSPETDKKPDDATAALPRPPDDPGVDPDEPHEDMPRRFRLF